ncbi:MAG TPA: HisA/HisF-related TIM barrel protein [Acidobacteriaceae bacterium]|jgi:phosphoribosylformimino-5-aminoimidazole carboxamide ribotide isomerase|nr:HisA/HisF-related TIM barrel protein [Acidobacteriaceae bacterium]
MLIPAIDLMDGHIVQLVQGERLALQSKDFDYWIDRFRAYPLVQLIDLNAAKLQGNNRELMQQILKKLPCQVGGGIRTAADAQALLDLGAKRVIFGSSLFTHEESASSEPLVRTEFASHLAASLGQDRLVFSVDTKGGRIAVRGWRHRLPVRPEQAIELLEPFCAAFLYTHVDTEGLMQGFPMAIAQQLRAVTKRQLIVAGGIRDRGEITALHSIGVDAVAGMAVYTGALST